jgi:tetratricopeptide (TPR) repeat protein
MAYLSEAYLLKGEIDRAAEISAEAASICRDDNFKVATAYSERALGLVARARGSLAQARGHLETALKLFASIDTRFQVARLQLLLAEVCHAAGDTVVAAERLQASLETFRRLRVPRYVERAEQLAATLGVTVV